jgi:hypothetical protein
MAILIGIWKRNTDGISIIMRWVPVLTAAAVLLAAPAFAQEALHESDGRYTYRSADNGVLRLDARTGQVSLCSRQDAGWSCQAMPDDRVAYEREIMRLQDENAALRKSLAEARPAAPKAGDPKPNEPKQNELRLRLPSQDDVDRMMNYVEKMWRRMIDIIVNAHNDHEKI